MSPSRLWPWPGLLRHPGVECVWMDTFPGCSLIDASVDARGLMHSHSLPAFPANPACRLFPLSCGGCEGFLQKCHKVLLKRFKGCLHPTGPLRGKTMLDKGLDLKENSVHGQTAGVRTGVSGQHTVLFFLFFHL